MNKAKFLGEFEQMVLLALIRQGEQAYGASVRQELHDVSGRDVAIGALYATLERLEKKAMVSSRLGEATPERGGKAKRYFSVTATGISELKRARTAMDSLWQGVALRAGAST